MEKIVTKNRRARYEYSILESHEAGIVLQGSEVKSLREGKVSLSGCYAKVDGGEIYLLGLHIPPYETGSGKREVTYAPKLRRRSAVAVGTGTRTFHLPPMIFKGPDPKRPRKLLLHKQEIHRLHGKMKERGLTLIPLSLYFKRGRVKVELGLCKGKRKYEKREIIRKKDLERMMNSER
ncbi:SsrA-binding protein [candidate division TA06 bacterium]|nr:SsrA-binding protein [candidate division TA06 bacterium]